MSCEGRGRKVRPTTNNWANIGKLNHLNHA